MKMLLAAVLIDAEHAALEHAVIAFDGVGVMIRRSRDRLAVLVAVMVHGIMAGELLAKVA